MGLRCLLNIEVEMFGDILMHESRVQGRDYDTCTLENSWKIESKVKVILVQILKSMTSLFLTCIFYKLFEDPSYFGGSGMEVLFKATQLCELIHL